VVSHTNCEATASRSSPFSTRGKNGRSSCELVALAFSHRDDRLPGSRAGSHSQRTTLSGRLGVMGLHQGYIRTALAGLLLHAQEVPPSEQ
jgi:hypothetical protein